MKPGSVWIFWIQRNLFQTIPLSGLIEIGMLVELLCTCLEVVVLSLSNVILNCVTGVEEITPELSSLSLTTSLKLFITQIHDCGFGLIGPSSGAHRVQNAYVQDYIYASTTWRVTSSVPTQYSLPQGP